MKTKCGFTGCKCEAKYVATQTVGKRQSLPVCEKHKPDASKRPEKLRHLPFFFVIRPIGG